MKKYTIIALVVLGIMLVSVSIQAQVISGATDDNAQDAVAAVTENVTTDADQDTNAATVLPPVITPNTGNDVDQDTVVADVTPNTGTDADQDVSNTIVSNPSTDADQDAGQVTPPTTPPNTNTESGRSSSSSSSGSRGGVSSYTRIVATTSPVTTSITTCPFITKYVNFNGNNDRDTVIRLQTFLSNSEKFALDINGIFDAKTESAVKSFQNKYANDILAPWGATIPSGSVYITTTKKINEIVCAQSLNLLENELAIIEAYKKNRTSSSQTQEPRIINPNVQTETTTSTGEEIGTTNTPNSPGIDNTAAVGKASVVSRFWNFIKGLFN